MRKAFTTTVSLAALMAAGSISEPARAGNEPYIGDVQLVAFNFCPRSYASAEGQLLAISQYSALFALIGITAGTLYQKRYCPRFDLRTGAVVQFVPSLLITALVAAHTETMLVEWHGRFIFALLWLVVVLSVGAISLLNLLIRQGSATHVASLFYLTPPVTALIAWALFDETLSALAVAGMGIAVTGVWLARR